MLYAVTIFLSAFLLFCVQPLMGRFVLPWFGGSAAVWTACLLFFQVVLLLGYLYAYAAVRWFAPRGQARLHVVLLLCSLVFLPLWPSARLKPLGTEEPTLRILLLLTVTVGLPYMLLASTSPLMQAWYVRTSPTGAPYRLFALSNLGSMLALIGYVTVVEPRYTLGLQSIGWSASYGLFIACAGLCAIRSTRDAPWPDSLGATTAVPPSRGLQTLWLALAACASVLLMAITHHVSQNVAPVPFLWVGMLSVYLLSFIICFEGHGLYWRWLYYPLLVAALSAMSYYLKSGNENVSAWQIIPIFLAALFVMCMVCHGELSGLRPPPRHLTSFYLMVSVGGALGGVFTGVIAPIVFPGYFELQVGLVACPLLVLIVSLRDARWRRGLRLATLGTVMLGGVVPFAWFLTQQARVQLDGRLLTVRGFYGVLSVTKSDEGTSEEHLSLTNGTICHGEQFTSGLRRRAPTSYYGPDSGVGLAISATRGAWTHRVGVVGLGAGTLAAYGRRGDVYRFYEINPLDIAIARTAFTYLNDARERLEVVLGDARLNMEREAPQHYDVLAVDAFSSDAIPLHLLTVEAFSQYFRHLSRRGILAVHISNHYLNLAPVVRAAAEYHGRKSVKIDADGGDNGLLYSEWVLIAADQGLLRSSTFGKATDVESIAGFRTWTDDYASLIGVLKKDED